MSLSNCLQARYLFIFVIKMIHNLTFVDIPKDAAYAVGELFGYYLIPITACVASAINLTFCRTIVINSKFMRHRKYRLLLAKAFIVGLHGKNYN